MRDTAESYQSCEFIKTYALELQIVQHCNLSCVGCAQSSPYVSGNDCLISIQRALSSLENVLRCSKLQILGGEPTLHEELDAILRTATASPIADSIVVKTNGLNLLKMSSTFWELVDKVIESVYPVTQRQILRSRSSLEDLALRHNVDLEFRSVSTFKHIIKESATESTRLKQLVFDHCEYKTFCHSVRSGRFYRCSPSVNLADRMPDDLGPDLLDSVDLFEPDGLFNRLQEFISSGHALRSCQYCLGSSGATFPHRQMRRTDSRRYADLHILRGAEHPC